MTLTDEQQAVVDGITQQTLDCLALARKQFPLYAIHSPPAIKWDIKAGRMLGQAQYDRTTCESAIRFNTQAALINPEAYKTVVPHEVAHIVAMALGMDKGHGWKWRRVCLELGGDGQRMSKGECYPGLQVHAPRRRMHCWQGPQGFFWFPKRRHEILMKSASRRMSCKVDRYLGSRLVERGQPLPDQLLADVHGMKAA